MNAHIQILQWDSEFFGFKVAKIIPARLSEECLREILRSLRDSDCKLVHWASDPDDSISQEAARLNHGFLADRKRTYLGLSDRVAVAQPTTSQSSGVSIEEYLQPDVSDELEQLALQSGFSSRYNLDPRMPSGSFERLYRLWIRNSVKKTIADAVFVAVSDGIVGLVTVGVKNGRADIGLLAVDERMRGRKIGPILVGRAGLWAVEKGLKEAQVVTQGDNKAACRLYENCGYSLEKEENFYHFWL